VILILKRMFFVLELLPIVKIRNKINIYWTTNAIRPIINIGGFCILCTCLKSIISLEVKVCTHRSPFNDVNTVELNQTY